MYSFLFVKHITTELWFLKIILHDNNQNKPAMRGPIVNGMEQSPSKNPTAWEAPEGPQRSYAIGPSIVIKQPSKMPK